VIPFAARHGQRGSLAVVQATWLLAIVVLGSLAAIDVGALLRGARVATAAADGAALAAAGATRRDAPAAPRTAADRIARAHGATLTTCDCGPSGAHVTVTLPIETLVLHRLGVAEVTASADARLVPVPTSSDDPTVPP
jgi:anthranilate phosphoribosyltransferase